MKEYLKKINKIIYFLKRIFLKNKKINGQDLFDFMNKNIGECFCNNLLYGSGESLNNIFRNLTGKPICEEDSTYYIYYYLANNNKKYLKVSNPEKGDIVISPTGSVEDDKVGGVGVIGEKSDIFAFENGKISIKSISFWKENYIDLGFPVFFYRLK